jgi:hypothetical protein
LPSAVFAVRSGDRLIKAKRFTNLQHAKAFFRLSRC